MEILVKESAPRGAGRAAYGHTYFMDGKVFLGVSAGGAGIENAVGVKPGMKKPENNGDAKVKRELASRKQKKEKDDYHSALQNAEPAAVKVPKGKAGKKGKSYEACYTA